MTKPKIPADPQWTNISAARPATPGTYLVRVESDCWFVAEFDGKMWTLPDNDGGLITHWAPLE